MPKNFFSYAGYIVAGILLIILTWQCNRTPKYIDRVIVKQRAYDSVKKEAKIVNDSLWRLYQADEKKIAALTTQSEQYRKSALGYRAKLHAALDSIDILKEVLPTDSGSTGRWINQLLLHIGDVETLLREEEAANDSLQASQIIKDSLNKEDKQRLIQQNNVLQAQIQACEELTASLKTAEQKRKAKTVRTGIIAAVLGFLSGWGGGRIGR